MLTNQSAQTERVLQALADPTRRTVFEHVARSPATVGAIAQKLPVSRPAVSQHLKVLKEAGLVTDRAEGTSRVYSIERSGLASLRAYLDTFWEMTLESFAEAAKEKENQ